MYEVIDAAEISPEFGFRWLVMVKKSGRLERAKHLGKRGFFKFREDAERAVFNANKYGTQNV